MAFRPITEDEIAPSSSGGFRPISQDEIEIESPSPSWGQAAKFVGKNLVGGIGDLLGMGADVVSPNLMGTPNQPSKLIKSFLSPYVDSPTLDETGQYQLGGAATDIIGAGARGAVFPEAPIVNAIISASGKTGEILSPEHPIIGNLLGIGTGILGTSAANRFAQGATSAGKAFERSSIGAQGKDYVKSRKALGLLTDEESGELTTRLNQAIEEISDSKGFGILRDPERLALRNQDILDEAGAVIGQGLKKADEIGAKPLVDFNGKDSAVNKLITTAKAEKGQVREAFNEFLDRFTDPVDGWDGTVESLNSWKSSIGSLAFSGTAKGALDPAVQRRVQRAITKDLENAVNRSVTSSGASSPSQWSTAMREYSNAKQLQPIFEEGVARGQGGTIDKAARAALRTTGGFLTTPTLIGGALGAGGGLPGIMTGAAIGALGSPTGAGLAGSALKNLGKAGSRLTDSSLATKLAAGVSGIPKEQVEVPQVSIKDVRSAISKVAENLPPMQKQESKMLDSALNRGEAKLKESEKTPEIKKIEAKIDADPIDSAIYEAESGRDPEAKNPSSSASGGFQLTKGTARALGVKDVFDLEDNYKGYQKLRAELESKFGSEPAVIYSGHFLGEPVLRKLLNGKPLTKTESEQVAYLKAKALPRFEKIYNRIVKSKIESV